MYYVRARSIFPIIKIAPVIAQDISAFYVIVIGNSIRALTRRPLQPLVRRHVRRLPDFEIRTFEITNSQK